MRRRRLLIAVLPVVVVATAALLVREWRASVRAEAQCQQVIDLSERLPANPDSPDVAVLGDSYAQGETLSDPSQAWPFLAFDSVAVDAIGGTGFVSEGPCGGQDFASRAAVVQALQSPIVVVQGGLNDVAAEPADVGDAAVELLEDLAGADAVYVVGPPLTPATDGAAVRRVDRILAEAADEAGVTYVSALDWSLTFSDDGQHPDEAGARSFAEHVATAVGATD